MDWTQDLRNELRASAEAATLDEARAAREAERLARAWTALIPRRDDDPDFAEILVHKVAGYNVELHDLTRRILMMVSASDALLARHGCLGLNHALPNMTLPEWVLAQRARARGIQVDVRADEGTAPRTFRDQHPPRHLREGYERVEVPLPSPASLDACEHGPSHAFPTTPVLFVATMNNYLNPLTPVMAELESRGIGVAVLMPQTGRAWPAARDIPSGVVHYSFEDLASCDASEFASDCASITSDWDACRAGLARAFLLEGIDLWPLLEPGLHAAFVDYIPHVRAYTRMARALVDRAGVRTAVCARLRRAAEISVCSEVQRCGGRSVMVIHGHIDPAPERTFADGTFRTADLVCVWGERQRRDILAKADGTLAERVAPLGNPGWDRLVRTLTNAGGARRAAIARSLGLDPGDFWFCVTTQPAAAQQTRSLCGSLLEVVGACVVLKPHPAEPPGAWDSLDHPGRLRVVPHGDIDLHDLVLASDAVVTHSSTTNVEALLAGVPVVTVAFPATRAIERLVRLEEFGLPFAGTPAELTAVARAAVADPAAFRARMTPIVARAAQDLVANAKDAGAAARVCDRIERMLAGAALAA